MLLFSLLFLLEALCHNGHVEAQSTAEMLKQVALQWQGPLPCNKWDCNCAFNRQRGCCCGAQEMYKVEEDTFTRMVKLWEGIDTLNDKVRALSASIRYSFKATMDPSLAVNIPGTNEHCFGPFNTNVSIPFSVVSLNDGAGYNPSLGIFTACQAGFYVFSFTTYSSVGENERLYYKVQMVRNTERISAVWENNREDSEDSATQVMMLELKAGDQVYTELIRGRKLCTHLQYNVFTGYMVYPINNE